MIEMKLSDYDNRLIDMYLNLYNTAKIECYGNAWSITSEDGIESFGGYKGFINYIESEVKQSLLCYALNNELNELVELFG